MSILKNIRERQNLTQEELSDKSGISVRTIQRIEAGTKPKGHTLKVLAKTLGIQEKELRNNNEIAENTQEKAIFQEEPISVNYSLLKLINLSSLPFVILPPLNILLPLIVMFATKQRNPIIKQIISVQILWTILAPILFMLVIFMKLGSESALITMILLALSNIFIILRNTMGLDKNKKLHYKLNFSII